MPRGGDDFRGKTLHLAKRAIERSLIPIESRIHQEHAERLRQRTLTLAIDVVAADLCDRATIRTL